MNWFLLVHKRYSKILNWQHDTYFASLMKKYVYFDEFMRFCNDNKNKFSKRDIIASLTYIHHLKKVDLLSPTFNSYNDFILNNINTFRSNISTLIHRYTILGHTKSLLFIYEHVLKNNLIHFNNKSISLIAWGYAKNNIQLPSLFTEINNILRGCIKTMSLHDLSLIVWAYAKGNRLPYAELVAIKNRVFYLLHSLDRLQDTNQQPQVTTKEPEDEEGKKGTEGKRGTERKKGDKEIEDQQTTQYITVDDNSVGNIVSVSDDVEKWTYKNKEWKGDTDECFISNEYMEEKQEDEKEDEKEDEQENEEEHEEENEEENWHEKREVVESSEDDKFDALGYKRNLFQDICIIMKAYAIMNKTDHLFFLFLFNFLIKNIKRKQLSITAQGITTIWICLREYQIKNKRVLEYALELSRFMRLDHTVNSSMMSEIVTSIHQLQIKDRRILFHLFYHLKKKCTNMHIQHLYNVIICLHQMKIYDHDVWKQLGVAIQRKAIDLELSQIKKLYNIFTVAGKSNDRILGALDTFIQIKEDVGIYGPI